VMKGARVRELVVRAHDKDARAGRKIEGGARDLVGGDALWAEAVELAEDLGERAEVGRIYAAAVSGASYVRAGLTVGSRGRAPAAVAAVRAERRERWRRARAVGASRGRERRRLRVRGLHRVAAGGRACERAWLVVVCPAGAWSTQGQEEAE
jgi:hypothetical protein